MGIMYDSITIEKPIEQLFTVIFQLQVLEEYDQQTKQFKEDLAKLFEDVKEKNGKKKIGAITYHPNGLCEWDNQYDKIHLAPWENKTEQNKKINRDCGIFKQYNVLWYMQFRQYLKKPISLTNIKLKHRDIITFMKKYATLSTEQQALLVDEQQQNGRMELERECYKMVNIIQPSYGDQGFTFHYGKQKIQTNVTHIAFLASEHLEAIKNLYETPYDSTYEFERALTKLLDACAYKEGKDVEERTVIDFSDLLIETNPSENDYFHYRERDYHYTFNFDTIEEALTAIEEKFAAVEDEMLQKLFKKIGLVPNTKG